MSEAFTNLPDHQLDAVAEQKLATKIQKQHNEEDIIALSMDNIKEAVVYTRKCCRDKIPDDELISLCYLALMRNAKNFKPGLGIRFFAFSKAGLRGELSQYWKRLDTVRGANAHADQEAVSEEPLESDSVDPDFASIFAADNWKLVKEVIERKTTRQERMVLDLAYQRYLNFQEIGKLLGVSRSAIQAAHARALRKIRNEINRRKLTF